MAVKRPFAERRLLIKPPLHLRRAAVAFVYRVLTKSGEEAGFCADCVILKHFIFTTSITHHYEALAYATPQHRRDRVDTL